MELRGIIHCHSTYSYDGKLSLSELKTLCLERGVQFVCMTEHVDEMTPESAQAFVKECEVLSDEEFCFIPGFEVAYLPRGAKDHAHVLMVGMREFLGTYAPSSDVLEKWMSKASFVVLAHPVRNNFVVDDSLLTHMDALEVWNQQYEGKHVPRTSSLRLLETLRARKSSVFGIGGVDFHRTEHFGAPFIRLTVDACAESAILEKLTTGAYIVEGKRMHFFGPLLNCEVLRKKYWFASLLSVAVISAGKMVNAFLARFGIKLPRFLKEIIRKRV